MAQSLFEKEATSQSEERDVGDENKPELSN
jgi:hypothetical protein